MANLRVITRAVLVLAFNARIVHNLAAEGYPEIPSSDTPAVSVTRTVPAHPTPSTVIRFLDLPPLDEPAPESPLFQDRAPALEGLSQPPTFGIIKASFPALADNNQTIPPDTHGAVGPRHLMTTLKTGVRIQQRDGAIIRTVGISNFWESVGPFLLTTGCSASYCRRQSVFDPRILYDRGADRWIFTALADARAATASLLLGVTEGGDPTANWRLFRIGVDPQGLSWADYPNVGFNQKWIVVQFNRISMTGDNFLSSRIYVFNRTNLYAGVVDPHTVFDDRSAFAQVPAFSYNLDAGTLYLVETWTGNSRSQGQLRLSAIRGDPGNESYDPGLAFPAGPAWGAAIRNLAPQAGTSSRVDTVDSRLQSLIYRNGTLWAAHTVYLPAQNPNHTAIQWWQLSTNGNVLQRGLIEDPGGTVFYGIPSLAVNRQNDLLIGYSRFSATNFPSASYSFRRADDPPGTLSAEHPIKAGEGPYVKLDEENVNRWGDFSASGVDPLDDLDFWTIQEYAAPPVGVEGRWGTWWAHIALENAPPSLPVLMVAPAGSENFRLSFFTDEGWRYTVESSESLIHPNWASAAVFPGNGMVQSLTNAAPTGLTKFFRLRVAPGSPQF